MQQNKKDIFADQMQAKNIRPNNKYRYISIISDRNDIPLTWLVNGRWLVLRYDAGAAALII